MSNDSVPWLVKLLAKTSIVEPVAWTFDGVARADVRTDRGGVTAAADDLEARGPWPGGVQGAAAELDRVAGRAPSGVAESLRRHEVERARVRDRPAAKRDRVVRVKRA
jgi:hypothetical protein